MTADSRLLARRLVECLRSGVIDAETIKQLSTALAVLYPADEFPAPLLAKLLTRHSHKPGRKRVSAERKERVAAAAVWARYNRDKGKELAATEAAELYGVKVSAVYRAAFEYKDAAMNKLTEKIIRDTEKIARVERTENVVPMSPPHFRKDNSR